MASAWRTGWRSTAKGGFMLTTDAGVQVFDKKGKSLGTIKVPRTPSNLAFSGPGQAHALHHRARGPLQVEDAFARARQGREVVCGRNPPRSGAHLRARPFIAGVLFRVR